MEKIQVSINKDLEDLNNKHTETNNIIPEIKNTLEGINSRISEAEKWIKELEDKMVEITFVEQNKAKKNENNWVQSKRRLGQYQMQQHFNYWGSRRGREKENIWEKFWRYYSWKFPQYGKGNNRTQEAQRIPYRKKTRRNTPRHIVINIRKTKHKERILKAARVKQWVIYKENSIHLTADLSAENLQDRREWQDIFNFMKGKNLQQDYCTLQESHSKLMEK